MMDKAIKVIAALGSIICGGYMIYQGESLGWIIAGFVGGIFVPLERIHQPLLILINNFGILLITGYYLANIKNKIFVRKIARSEMPALLLYVDTIFHSVRLNL